MQSRFRYDIKTFMPCRYTDKNDLIHRVNNTFVTYGGVIYIAVLSNHSSSPSKLCWDLMNPLDGNRVKKIDVNDPQLDISAIEVGYYTDFNHKDASYLIRYPQKRYTQGLSNQNTFRKSINGGNTGNGGWEMYGNRGLVSALYGRFMPMAKAVEALDSKRLNSVALSRDVAIERTGVGIKMMYVKTVNVGYLTEESELVVPEKKNSWVARKYVNEILG